MGRAREIIKKNCIVCNKEFMQMRHYKGCCSRDCNNVLIRRSRPNTFKICEFCGNKFGPVEYLAKRFCSYKCKVKAQTTGRLTVRRTKKKARNAQALLRYYIQKGKITRPTKCEECNKEAKIEGAHHNYDQPLKVRWLCRSCHIKWDKKEPKNATYIVSRYCKYTKTNKVIRNGEEIEWSLDG